MSAEKAAALEFFKNGFSCSQAILAAFADGFALPRETALKIAAGLGGGLKCGEVCGAVSGAVLVIGLKYGPTDPKDKEAKKICNAKTEDFMRAFREKQGATRCMDLLGCDVSTPEGMQKARDEKLFTTRCVDLVSDAVDILEEKL